MTVDLAKHEKEVSNLSRLVKEQAGQLFVVLVSMLDRLVLVGLMARLWGDVQFAQWSALAAFAAFGSLFEFGFNLYYNNRITFEAERGQPDQARATLAEANTIFVLCAGLGLICMCAVLKLTGAGGGDLSQTNFLAGAALVAASTLRLSSIGMSSLYRANRAFARFAFISASSELARIAVTIAAIVGGADILWAAAAALLSQLAAPMTVIFLDARHRFFPHRIEFSWPRGDSLKQSINMSGAYFGQMLPVIFWTALPIIILEALVDSPRLLVSFVLVRTLANMARLPLQTFGVVIGLECGRRIAAGAFPEAMNAFSTGARLFAVIGGLLCGIVIFGGEQLIFLQTGQVSLFNLPIAAAAMLPILIGSTTVLVHNILLSANEPWLALVGRWLQVAITIIAWFIFPGLDAATRMMCALAAGEILGYLPFAYWGASRLIPAAKFLFYLRNTLITVVAAACSAGICIISFALVGKANVVEAVTSLALIGVLCLILTLSFGFDGESRSRAINGLSKRFVGKSL